jgi:NAD dependent epimerase/dehydratase family
VLKVVQQRVRPNSDHIRITPQIAFRAKARPRIAPFRCAAREGSAQRDQYPPPLRRDRFGRIIKALAGEKIPVYGTGMNVRDWLYVADTRARCLRSRSTAKSARPTASGDATRARTLPL